MINLYSFQIIPSIRSGEGPSMVPLQKAKGRKNEMTSLNVLKGLSLQPAEMLQSFNSAALAVVADSGEGEDR